MPRTSQPCLWPRPCWLRLYQCLCRSPLDPVTVALGLKQKPPAARGRHGGAHKCPVRHALQYTRCASYTPLVCVSSFCDHQAVRGRAVAYNVVGVEKSGGTSGALKAPSCTRVRLRYSPGRNRFPRETGCRPAKPHHRVTVGPLRGLPLHTPNRMPAVGVVQAFFRDPPKAAMRMYVLWGAACVINGSKSAAEWSRSAVRVHICRAHRRRCARQQQRPRVM